MSVPENVPASAFIYMILARDPHPGQEVEVSISLLSINFFQLSLFKKWLSQLTSKQVHFLKEAMVFQYAEEC